MLRPIKLMKIFEVAWLSIAVLSFGMALYKIIGGSQVEHSYYLFLITFLGVMMFLLKRKSRKFLEKKYKDAEEAHKQRDAEAISKKV